MLDRQASPARGGPPTAEDVARIAGVSRQTVSNTINFPERVAESTRTRVQAAIDELGYRTSRLGRSLKGGASRLIGYRIPPAQRGDASPILDHFLHGLSAVARDHDYQVLLFLPRDDQDEAASHREMISTATVDGLILTDTIPDDARVAHLADQGLPFVTFGRTTLNTAHSWVDVDGAHGVRMAVDHLVDGGHERIAFVGHDAAPNYVQDRYRGYTDGLGIHGLDPLEPFDMRPGTAGVDLLRSRLDADDAPTACIAATDVLAMRIIESADALGHEVGRRGLAVVGFDDSPLAEVVTPALTSIHQPMAAVTHEVMRLLLQEIRGDEPEGVLVAPHLVVRESS